MYAARVPDLDWNAFRALPGASWRNWELLCHGLIQRNYGRFGRLVAVRVQPVVEFHLTLTEDCELGKKGEQWGWQCKFWDDDKPALNKSRKDVIEKAFGNQPKHLPDLDHFVIWTHQALREADWNWINEHKPEGVEVHTWWDDHVANLLTGDAEILRHTYFGTAVLRPEALQAAFQDTGETLRGLKPEIHITVREERLLGALRGRMDDWGAVSERADRLASTVTALRGLPPSSLGTHYSDVTGVLIQEAEDAIAVATDIAAQLEKQLLFKAIEMAARAPRTRDEKASQALNDLVRALDDADEDEHRDTVSSASAYLAATTQLLEQFAVQLQMPLVVVQGTVGAGKTQLSARLAAAAGADPAGAIVPAISFRGDEIDLDRLASVAGHRAMQIDEFLEALDAAGARAGQRLPIIIDGLHESASPPAWQDALARLRSKVSRLNNVFVVVTIRPSYADDCLPENVRGLELSGFRIGWRRACERYFELYKIRADLDLLPARRFEDPLFVRIFCEAANPDRENWVDLGAVPPSLVDALDVYVAKALSRISRRLRMDDAELRRRVQALAAALWDADARTIPLGEAKEIVKDDPLELDRSIALALAEEGVLDRDRDSGVGETVGPTFDALGGYLIADALVPNGQARDAALEAIKGRLIGAEAHPLAEDVRQALGHLLNRRAHVSLREATTEPELQRVATLDVVVADPSTVTVDDTDALMKLVTDGEQLGDLWWIAVRVRAVPDHPFNALWIDQTLRRLNVAPRDLDWTEMLRANSEVLTHEVEELTARWRTGLESDDYLHARWLAWVLTSTDRALRDRATEALYWYGRHDPAGLHDLTLDLLSVNDLYVPERLLAASYGVAMANQVASTEWAEAVPSFLDGLDKAIFAPEAVPLTAHWLFREYAIGVRRLVCDLHPYLAGDRQPLGHDAVPVPEDEPSEIDADDKRYDEVRMTLAMDFHNYTLGRLVEDRGNYDFEHDGHRKLVAEVMGRIWDLGWRSERFGALDREVAGSGYRRHEMDAARVDRYGKKYGWIAFYEAAGRRAHEGTLRDDRLSDVDIDPSFPQTPSALPLEVPIWVKTRHKTNESWVGKAAVPIPDELLRPPVLDGASGPWVCLDGFLTLDDESAKRRVFAFLWAALIPTGTWAALAESLTHGGVGRHTMPEPAGDYYTFAGEIPWSPTFAASLQLDNLPDATVEIRTLEDGTELTLTGTAHEHNWESYHSVTNRADNGIVPSRAICKRLELRGLPQTFDLVESDGSLASRCYSAPIGFGGRLLYLREDLLERYMRETGTELAWLVWGERELRVDDWRNIPQWYGDLRRKGKDQHRRVVSLTELKSRCT